MSLLSIECTGYVNNSATSPWQGEATSRMDCEAMVARRDTLMLSQDTYKAACLTRDLIRHGGLCGSCFNQDSVKWGAIPHTSPWMQRSRCSHNENRISPYVVQLDLHVRSTPRSCSHRCLQTWWSRQKAIHCHGGPCGCQHLTSCSIGKWCHDREWPRLAGHLGPKRAKMRAPKCGWERNIRGLECFLPVRVWRVSSRTFSRHR